MRDPINVVIAEDEAPMLGALVSMVNAAGQPFRVVGAARDGDEALRQILQTRADLALLDIQMPKLSGLDVLRVLRERQLETKVVVISGYDQFQYAQQALRHGACEYLLKPVTPAQMESLLTDMAAKLSAEAQASQAFSPELVLAGARVRFPKAYACYLMALFALGNYPYAAHPEIEVEFSPADIANTSVKEVLMEGERAWFTQGVEPWEQCVLLGLNAEERIRPAAQALFEELTRAAGTVSPQLPVTLAISRSLNEDNAGEEARRLSNELRKGAIFGKSILIGSGLSARSQSIQQLFNRCAVYEEQMVAAISKGDMKRLKVLLADEINYWSSSECPSSMMLNLIKFQFIHLGNAASGNLSGTNALPGDWDGHFDRALSQSLGWKQLYERLCEMMERLSDNKPQSGSGEILRQIDEYINKNYAAHINTQTLSRRFGFVPSYTSKLFRQYKGMSPSEYLTHVRIEKAKELIRSITDVNVADIASAVGFSDPSYFSRLFRRITGMLPTELRDRNDIQDK
jgi:two-component system response regulator YesN